MPNIKPKVSVIIPAYESHKTIEGCLAAIQAQTFSEFEIIVIDSSPDNSVEKIVQKYFPDVQYEHSLKRLLPHAARNCGVLKAKGDLLVFTDPDIYPEPTWLDKLVTSYQDTGYVIVGSIACFGRKWLDIGAHLCKFDKWLPGGRPRFTDISPTGNMLCSLRVFKDLGGFSNELITGDTEFSWRLTLHGKKMWFLPSAVVYHKHITSMLSLLRERYQRGKEFAYLRLKTGNWNQIRIIFYISVSVLPLRLFKILGRVAINALQARLLRDYVLTFPVVMAGWSAWLLGEIVIYLKKLTGSSSQG